MNLIWQKGITTFSPNSFARPGRSEECGSAMSSGAVALRFEEIRYTLKQIRELPWIDQSRLVLAGFSEGGLTAANYRGSGFKG